MRDGIGARAALGTLGVCAVMAITHPASADDRPAEGGDGFGAAGTVVLGGDFRAGYSKTSAGDSEIVTSDLGVGVDLDVFVVPRLSVGLAGVLSRGKASSSTSGQDQGSSRWWTAGAAVRVGYYVPFTERVGFWPMVSAGATHVSLVGNGAEMLDGHVDQVKLLANLVFHVDRGWFLTITPGLVAYTTSNSGIGATNFGAPNIALGFGGYF